MSERREFFIEYLESDNKIIKFKKPICLSTVLGAYQYSITVEYSKLNVCGFGRIMRDALCSLGNLIIYKLDKDSDNDDIKNFKKNIEEISSK